MTTNQDPQKKANLKNSVLKFFGLQGKNKTNDLTLEQWEQLEMRKPTIHARSPRELF